MTQYSTPSGRALDDAQIQRLEALLAALPASNHDAAGYTYFRDGAQLVRGAQTFAAFHQLGCAFELRDDSLEDGEFAADYLSVLVDGFSILQVSGFDEDRFPARVLYLMRVRRRHGRDVPEPRWEAVFTDRGWLYLNEINLSNEVLAERIRNAEDGA